MGGSFWPFTCRGVRGLNTDALGLDSIERIKNRFKGARRARDEERSADTVRYCQECVELGLKGILRLRGVEYPKKHDISTVLDQYEDRFSE
ncbi:MAG: HEPN domain-containing protein [Candidatus Lokiarchaeota archaeon]|nr:HEPN domain-containing protein [Candidatus Lokiarchaeota archaeon]